MVKKKYKYYIGIDPGVNTGVAVWNREDKYFELITTLPIHAAMKIIKDSDCDNTLVRIEDARLRKWFGDRSNAKLQGAGSVKRDCSIWESMLKDYGFNYQLVAPKNNKTKMSAEKFKLTTGYNGSTSEHARDAAMLVFGF
jgi:hypothetical protein